MTSEQRVYEILNAITRRHGEMDLSLANLGGLADLCPQRLGLLLKSVTGKTFRHYLRELRIAYARDLLCTSSLSIKEIAGVLKYGAVSGFSRDFRTVFGVAPSVFRRRSKGPSAE